MIIYWTWIQDGCRQRTEELTRNQIDSFWGMLITVLIFGSLYNTSVFQSTALLTLLWIVQTVVRVYNCLVIHDARLPGKCINYRVCCILLSLFIPFNLLVCIVRDIFNEVAWALFCSFYTFSKVRLPWQPLKNSDACNHGIYLCSFITLGKFQKSCVYFFYCFLRCGNVKPCCNFK